MSSKSLFQKFMALTAKYPETIPITALTIGAATWAVGFPMWFAKNSPDTVISKSSRGGWGADHYSVERQENHPYQNLKEHPEKFRHNPLIYWNGARGDGMNIRIFKRVPGYEEFPHESFPMSKPPTPAN